MSFKVTHKIWLTILEPRTVLKKGRRKRNRVIKSSKHKWRGQPLCNQCMPLSEKKGRIGRLLLHRSYSIMIISLINWLGMTQFLRFPLIVRYKKIITLLLFINWRRKQIFKMEGWRGVLFRIKPCRGSTSFRVVKRSQPIPTRKARGAVSLSFKIHQSSFLRRFRWRWRTESTATSPNNWPLQNQNSKNKLKAVTMYSNCRNPIIKIQRWFFPKDLSHST